jgi:hypothetical protein
LKKPDNSIKYKTFIVSKDNPLTWNPIDIPGTSPTTNSYGQLNQYNYDNLYQKYENLKQEYNEFRNEGYTSSTLDSLRRELKEKENTINQLVTQQNNKKIYQSQNYATVYSYQNQNQGNNNFNIDNYGNIVNLGNTGYDYKTNNELRMTYNYLVNENYDLKNKLNQYENHFNQQNEVIYLDNNFNEIRDSISTNNQVGFNQAFDKLKTDIDTYTQNNYNAIITMKDQEIEKWKNEEKLRKEREDQELKALISAYDTSLSMGERENAELKKRLKELEGYF